MFSQPTRVISQFHWPMDEGAGADPTGGEITAVGLREANKQLVQSGDIPPMMLFHGSPAWKVDRTFGHYITPATSNYAKLTGSTRCQFPTNSFSVLVWVKFSGTSYTFPSVVSHVRGSDSRGWAIRINTGAPNVGAPYFFIYDATNIAHTLSSSVPTLNDGKWHMIAAVCDRTAQIVRLSIDGTAFWNSGSAASVGSLTSDGTSLLRIGDSSEGGTTGFPGGVADLRIYTDRAITLSEIQRRYREKITRKIDFSINRRLFLNQSPPTVLGVGGNNAISIIG